MIEILYLDLYDFQEFCFAYKVGFYTDNRKYKCNKMNGEIRS